jgi:hypothetical protein
MKYYAMVEPGPFEGSVSEIVISEADILKHMRKRCADKYGQSEILDSVLLDEFLIVNWAYEVNTPAWGITF